MKVAFRLSLCVAVGGLISACGAETGTGHNKGGEGGAGGDSMTMGSGGSTGGGGSNPNGGNTGRAGNGGGGTVGGGGMGMGMAGSGAAGTGGSRADGGMMMPPPAGGKVNWTTQKFDPNRTGWNPNEKTLTVANVSDPMKFGKLFSRQVDGHIYAQPLVVTNLNVAGKVRDVVFLVTMTNNAYAFDANDTAKDSKELWKVNFGMPVTPVQVNACCPDITPFIGATATPVIDTTTNTMYFTTKTNENGTLTYKLHALDILTGAEKMGAPVVISGSVMGTGDGAMGGMLAFDAKRHHNRPGLLLQNGTVYIGFASHTDTQPYHGWVFGYDAATLMRKYMFVTNPNKGNGAGIWMSGNGLVGDGDNIYFSTGNGLNNGTDPMTNPPSLGEAMVKLDNTLKLVDWHIRGDYANLDKGDTDYGIGGPLLIPEADELIMGGKDAWALVYDKKNLGHYQPDDKMAVVQKFKGTGQFMFGGMHAGGFVYWKSTMNGPMVFGWPGGSRLLGFKLGPDKKFVEMPVAVGPDSTPAQQGSGSMVLSSNGGMDGIVWATRPVGGDINQHTRPGILSAYNADTGKLLWSSTTMKDRDDVGLHATQSYPTVVNGKVYCPSWTGSTVDGAAHSTTSVGTLQVYGLLN